jgi:hypothetical protein
MNPETMFFPIIICIRVQYYFFFIVIDTNDAWFVVDGYFCHALTYFEENVIVLEYIKLTSNQFKLFHQMQ